VDVILDCQMLIPGISHVMRDYIALTILLWRIRHVNYGGNLHM